MSALFFKDMDKLKLSNALRCYCSNNSNLPLFRTLDYSRFELSIQQDSIKKGITFVVPFTNKNGEQFAWLKNN